MTENTGVVFGFRKKRNPDAEGKFFVFEFDGADISNEEWKQSVSSDICAETVGRGIGDPVFMWRNPNYE